MSRLLSPLMLVLAGLSGCEVPRPPMEFTGPTYMLGILRTGPRTEPLSEEESARYFGGHFANMTRLAKEGHLLLAGPYGSNKSAKDLRGIFILDTDSLEHARRLAETDPCFQAGIFRFEFHAMQTTFAMHAMQKAELARLAANERSGMTVPPGAGCRNYVMVTVADANRAAALQAHDAVYLFAKIARNRALAFVDCANHDEAEALLKPLRTQLGELTIDEWFGSDLLATAWSTASPR